MHKAEEGSGTCNGAETDPAQISLDVNALISSSPSAPRAYQDSGSNGQLSGSGPVTPTDVSDSTITTSRPVRSTITTTDNTAAIPEREEPRGDYDDNNQVQLPDTFTGLIFQAAAALVTSRHQTGDSPANLSPQPKPQQGDSPTNLSLVWATLLFGFAFTMSWTMLRNHHRKIASFCSNAGVFLGALAFFLIVRIVADERLRWLVWAVGGVLLVVFAYKIGLEMGIWHGVGQVGEVIKTRVGQVGEMIKTRVGQVGEVIKTRVAMWIM